MYAKLKSLTAIGRKHEGFRKYLKNTGWLFGGQMLRLILGLFVGVTVARHLGPSDFGLYNYILSIVALVTVFAQLGIQSIAQREMIAQPESKNKILGTCFVINGISGVLLYALMLLIVVLGKTPEDQIPLYVVLGAGLILLPFEHIEMWFQSQVQARLSVIASVITMLLYSGAKVIAIYAGWSLLPFAVISFFEILTLSLIKIRFYQLNYGSIMEWRLSKELAGNLLKESWPVMFSALAITIYMRIDQIMLGSMMGNKAVGEYSAATKLSSIWYFVPMLLANSLYPSIVRAKERSEDLYLKRLRGFMALNSAIAYLIILPVTLLSPFIIVLLYGNQYQAAASILTIHVWASLFVFTGVCRGQYLLTEKMHRFSLISTCVGAVVNMTMNYLLIPSYGGVGAAFATLFSQAVAAYWSSAFIPGSKQLFWMQTKSLFLIGK